MKRRVTKSKTSAVRRPAPAASSKGPARPEERRASPRVRPERSARLVDISAGGVCVETAAALTPEGVYDLILRLDDRRITVACRVVQLHRLGELRRASMAFDRLLESDRGFIEESLVREAAERLTVIIR
jgi:c-di-GMP-binding flagellar brake protein YcgR